MAGICAAAGVAGAAGGPGPAGPGRRMRWWKRWTAAGRGLQDEPPMTRFLAEQLSTAHWFDQRRTREVLDWAPEVSIEDGLRRLAAHYRPTAN